MSSNLTSGCSGTRWPNLWAGGCGWAGGPLDGDVPRCKFRGAKVTTVLRFRSVFFLYHYNLKP